MRHRPAADHSGGCGADEPKMRAPGVRSVAFVLVSLRVLNCVPTGDLQAVSVTYEYRIILTLEVTEREIILLDIGSHDEVYR